MDKRKIIGRGKIPQPKATKIVQGAGHEKRCWKII